MYLCWYSFFSLWRLEVGLNTMRQNLPECGIYAHDGIGHSKHFCSNTTTTTTTNKDKPTENIYENTKTSWGPALWAPALYLNWLGTYINTQVFVKAVCSRWLVKHIRCGQKAHKDNFIIAENVGARTLKWQQNLEAIITDTDRCSQVFHIRKS